MGPLSAIDDIIAAPITGVFRAPVAVIRVSGDGCWEIAKRIFQSSSLSQIEKPRHAYYGQIVDDQRTVLDDGILLLFESGHSYTNEESFEISCHGSPQIVRSVLNLILAHGAREARPGEFTERAFMNGRIDLTQAEGVREAIEADTEIQTKRAASLRSGALSKQIAELEEPIASLLALTEATGDFAEEIGELDREQAHAEIERIIALINAMLSGFESSRIAREGLRIAIVGRPNVGKSSLLNALVGTDRAIVTAAPGTTRDTIEEAVQIEGFPVVLTDTAGIRTSEDPIEAIGIERARRAVEQADQVWLVFDVSRGWTPSDQQVLDSLPKPPSMLIGNKCDLGAQASDAVIVSAAKRIGLERLAHHVRSAFQESGVGIALINERHREHLTEARHLLEHAAETLLTDLPADLVCVDLQFALDSLGRITGRTPSEDLLERVFRDFCIGK